MGTKGTPSPGVGPLEQKSRRSGSSFVQAEGAMKVAIGGAASGPLAGVRVVDFTTVVSGPLCTQVLGDLGADVVKVEAPRGDSARRMGPPFRGGFGPVWVQFNRNKRAIVIDLQ